MTPEPVPPHDDAQKSASHAENTQAQAWMRRFFRSEGAYLDWLQEPAAHLVEARDSTLDIDSRLVALGNLFDALDRTHIHLSALAQQEIIDPHLLAELELVMPDYAEEMLATADALWQDELALLLATRGLSPRRVRDLSSAELDSLDAYFMQRVYPLLTPLAVDPGHPFPFISSGSANLLVELRDTRRVASNENRRLYARVKVPTTYPILVDLRRDTAVTALQDEHLTKAKVPSNFVWCGDLVRHFVAKLFTGMEITRVHFFRLIRAGTAKAGDHRGLNPPRHRLGGRDQSAAPVVRLDIERGMPLATAQWLGKHIGVPAHGIVRSDLILELACLPPLFTQVCANAESGDSPDG